MAQEKLTFVQEMKPIWEEALDYTSRKLMLRLEGIKITEPNDGVFHEYGSRMLPALDGGGIEPPHKFN